MIDFDFFSKTDSFSVPIGSSASVIKDKVLIIGGIELNESPSSNPFLQVRCVNILSTEWTPSFVDSKSILNRSFHASVTLKESIIIFGGCEKRYDQQYRLIPSKEIVKIDNTAFGLKCSILAESLHIQKQGLTAVVVGKESDKVLLFGGIGPLNETLKTPYSSEVFLFQEKSNEVISIEISATGERPSARAFHSCIPFGDINQYALIFGGQAESKTALNDFWILDISEILAALDAPPEAAPVVPDKKAAKPAKGKEKEVKGPVAYWTKLSSSTPLCPPRYMHSSCIVSPKGSPSSSVFVFGGLTEAGPALLGDVFVSTLAKNEQGKFSASEFRSVERAPAVMGKGAKGKLPSNLSVYGMAVATVSDSVLKFAKANPNLSFDRTGFNTALPPATAATDLGGEVVLEGESSQPSLLLIFGGKRAVRPSQPAASLNAKALRQLDAENRHLENVSYMLVLNQESKLVRKILRSVKANNADLFAEAKTVDDTKGRNTQRVEFPDGSVYEGEVANILPIEPDDDITDEEGGEGAKPEGDDLSTERSIVPISSDIPHGLGFMQYANGSRYDGQWSNGLRHGSGKFVDSEGSVYDGDFNNDFQTGIGTLVSRDGTNYTGGFLNGQYDGDGTISYPNGDVFKGSFSRGLRDGAGTLTIKEFGTAQRGVWKMDRPSGKGAAENLSVESVHVNYCETELPLAGELKKTIKLGDSRAKNNVTSKGLYSGPIEDGMPSGEEGVCKYIDGSEYRGSWRSGRRNGLGTFTFPNLDEYIGKWVGDRRCGFGKLSSALGNTYEGNWENNLQHGQGILHLKDGYRYVGEFVRGKRHGFGKLLMPNSENVCFEGNWVEDCKQ